MIRSLLALFVSCFLAASARAEQISVTQWGVGLYGAPYAVAMDQGLFKSAGINVTGILSSYGGGSTVRNMLAAETPYAEVALSAAIAAAAQGVPLVIVNAGTRNVAEFVWVTMPNSPIREMKDLIGKKVGFTAPKSATEMLLIMSLEAGGVKPESVQRVATGGYGPGLTAMEQGGVVAAPIIEPAWTKDRDKYRPVFFVKDLLPIMASTVGVTTREFAAKEPAKLRAIIEGRRRGVEALYRDPVAAAAILTKHYTIDPKVAEASIANMAAAKTWSDGRFERAALDRMAEGLRIIGELKGPMDWAGLVDENFLPPELRGGVKSP
ncbi:MAG: ABC transporter substrate-binding protein [Elsteraceae bacterium]